MINSPALTWHWHFLVKNKCRNFLLRDCDLATTQGDTKDCSHKVVNLQMLRLGSKVEKMLHFNDFRKHASGLRQWQKSDVAAYIFAGGTRNIDKYGGIIMHCIFANTYFVSVMLSVVLERSNVRKIELELGSTNVAELRALAHRGQFLVCPPFLQYSLLHIYISLTCE